MLNKRAINEEQSLTFTTSRHRHRVCHSTSVSIRYLSKWCHMFSPHGHYYSHHAHSSVILCLSNDDNNEASSSAPTTDAQNIHLGTYPFVQAAWSPFSYSFCFFFRLQSSLSVADWSSLLPISIFFQSVSFACQVFGCPFGPFLLCPGKITAALPGLLLKRTQLLRWVGSQQIYKIYTSKVSGWGLRIR